MTLPALEISRLPPQAQKLLQPEAPPQLRKLASRGIVPGLRPADLLTVLVALADGEDDIGTTARATLAALPEPVLNGAIAADLEPRAIDALVMLYASNEVVIERLLAMPRLEMETVERLASVASERVAELVAVNEQRVLLHPAIIEKLYLNRNTRMTTAERLIELAARNKVELSGLAVYREAVAALEGEIIFEASEEPLPDDIMYASTRDLATSLDSGVVVEDTHEINDEGSEVVRAKNVPLHKAYSDMSISQKVRGAFTGGRAFRMFAYRDAKRLVATAAIRSPQVNEEEVQVITRSKEVNTDVLRIIAKSGRWTRDSTIKLNLVLNPRTPFAETMRLIPHLREHELKGLMKDRNVPAAVQNAAKQHMQRRSKG